MYSKLYEVFHHWYYGNSVSGGEIYFYSDPHFSDEEMKYLRKNYIGDEEQVKRINSKVTKNDAIVILGDVGKVDWIKKLRGYKVLVTGNHDAGASRYKRVEEFLDANKLENPNMEYIKSKYIPVQSKSRPVQALDNVWYRDNKLFDEVYTGPLFISDKILLSHEPIDFLYALNIHGHDHNNKDFVDNTHLNVCAELIDYTPVSLKSIIESGMLKNIDSIHRVTIDRATENKNTR